MGTVNALVITGYGVNSHLETAHTARPGRSRQGRCGALSDLVAAKVRLAEYHFLIFPGGFLDGDDLGAAQAAAMRWRYLKDAAGTPLLQHLQDFLDQGKLILGICNGFQLLVKLGVLPRWAASVLSVRFPWATTIQPVTRIAGCICCPILKAPAFLPKGCPCWPCLSGHGEGKLVPENEQCLRRLEAEQLIAPSVC